MKDIVWKLLRKNISAGQMTGYAVANLAGLMIVIASLQFYFDISSAASSDDDKLIPENYLIISKRVDGLGSLTGGNDAFEFSAADIADLESQPWAKSVGEFTSAGFNVYAGMDFGGRSMSTALFLESVPDDYFDVKLPGWKFDPERDNTVPIIISKDYLTLYNFGFAPSRGMPQVSEAMIGLVPLKLAVSGRGEQRIFNGKIVGFSSRLNTIAVPEEFMDWANGRFSEQIESNPSRLIVRVEDTGNPEVEKYLSSKGYEVGGDKAGAGRAAYIMKVITGVVVMIGGIITLLSLVILMLSISLLIEKNRDKISTLILLGYSPRRVAGYYVKIVAALNASVLAMAVGAMFVARYFWLKPVRSIGVPDSSVVVSILCGLGVMAVVTAVNILYIRRSIRRLQ